MPKIFISYRRADTGYVATMLADKLVEEYGPGSVFFDIDNIPLGVDFRKHIESAVTRCDVLIALVGDTWLTCAHEDGTRRLEDPSDFVRLEIEAALNRNIPVIPVLTGQARMPGEKDLPETLTAFCFRNASELRSGSDLRLHVDRLKAGLDAIFKRSTLKSSKSSGIRNKPDATPAKTSLSAALPATPERVAPPEVQTPRVPPPLPVRATSNAVTSKPRKAERKTTPSDNPAWKFFKVAARRALLMDRPNTVISKVFRVCFLTGFVLCFLISAVMAMVFLFSKPDKEVNRTTEFIAFVMIQMFIWIPLYVFTWIPAVVFDAPRPASEWVDEN